MSQIDRLESAIRVILREKTRAYIAIDGMAASGKTTLAKALSSRFSSCAVTYMDDFTMPFEARYPGYFEKTLSNADVARFDREVLSPLLCGEAAVYRPYRCHPVPGFGDPVVIPADCAVVIVEGAYCLHPDLFGRYDLRVLSLIDEDTQRERILKRNGSEQLQRFESLWIPMENRHIAARRLKETCDLVISPDPAI